MVFGKKHIEVSNKGNQIITQDKKIAKLLIKKKELVKKGRGISRQIEQLEKDRNKLALQVQKIKDKIIPFARRIKKEHLSKYEDIQSLELKGDDIIITTFDYIEEYRKQLDKKIKEGQL
ncbi:MAG: hypothetical protein ACTSPI_13220 [Candidatus Heimdallarchaeaceae archaeon]